MTGLFGFRNSKGEWFAYEDGSPDDLGFGIFMWWVLFPPGMVLALIADAMGWGK